MSDISLIQKCLEKIATIEGNIDEILPEELLNIMKVRRSMLSNLEQKWKKNKGKYET